MNQDSMHCLNVNQWDDLKEVYKKDWPRGVTGYYALDTLSKWMDQGLDYGFKVLNPFSKPENGMVAVIKDEKEFIEMLIECPQDDTRNLEEALKTTKLIDWNRDIVVLFPPQHVVEGVKKIAGDVNMDVAWVHSLKRYILNNESPLFTVCLPEGLTFKQLTEDYIDLVDSTWAHRYPGSVKYFQLLIASKSGYGLFKDDQLISFGFIKEIGALGHLYTLEEHRRKGYGELVTKLICNERLKEGKHVYSFCIDENVQSCNMHKKLGFEDCGSVFSMQLSPRS